MLISDVLLVEPTFVQAGLLLWGSCSCRVSAFLALSTLRICLPFGWFETALFRVSGLRPNSSFACQVWIWKQSRPQLVRWRDGTFFLGRGNRFVWKSQESIHGKSSIIKFQHGSPTAVGLWQARWGWGQASRSELLSFHMGKTKKCVAQQNSGIGVATAGPAVANVTGLHATRLAKHCQAGLMQSVFAFPGGLVLFGGFKFIFWKMPARSRGMHRGLWSCWRMDAQAKWLPYRSKWFIPATSLGDQSWSRGVQNDRIFMEQLLELQTRMKLGFMKCLL